MSKPSGQPVVDLSVLGEEYSDTSIPKVLRLVQEIYIKNSVSGTRTSFDLPRLILDLTNPGKEGVCRSLNDLCHDSVAEDLGKVSNPSYLY